MAFRIHRKRVFLCCALLLIAVAGALLARPAWHLLSASWNDVDERTALPSGMLDDASRLNMTAVSEVFPVPEEAHEAELQLSQLLLRAGQEKLRVSIGGARHSMGGHTLAQGSIAINMRPFDDMQLDAERKLLLVQSGAIWAQVIPFLDAQGLSLGVLQSDNSFSVGGSISVNCHGWAFDQPPIASTVESLRLMLADGSIRRCARDENPELFALVLGGYGLFGVILDVELRVVPNECYRLKPQVVPIEAALQAFEKDVRGDALVRMFYGRMKVVPEDMLGQVVLNVLSLEAGESPPVLKTKGLEGLRRAVFRGAVDSDYGKRLRWDAESRLHPLLNEGLYSRNQLINEGVELFENRSSASTDILHEYFVPEHALHRFVELARAAMAEHACNLLNVTLRSVNEDSDTFLRYADQPMLAFVMLFNQKRTQQGEQEMQRVTRALIEAALSVGGRHYLPYRLHASKEQFQRAYPMAEEFFRKKRRFDPDELFQNQFYERYGQAAPTEDE
jgi:FAD/FMN-containing dehydrogenase